MAYSDKVLDHYENPRNVGSLPKDDKSVGTGLVGAPECGDVMKLQIKVSRKHFLSCTICGWKTDPVDKLIYDVSASTCPNCKTNEHVDVFFADLIEDAKFKTFGCGSAIASSSLATEWVKGKTVDEALQIKNTDIVRELSLPPVKIHCSVLAEDAIRAAIADWKKKQEESKKQEEDHKL